MWGTLYPFLSIILPSTTPIRAYIENIKDLCPEICDFISDEVVKGHIRHRFGRTTTVEYSPTRPCLTFPRLVPN